MLAVTTDNQVVRTPSPAMDQQAGKILKATTDRQVAEILRATPDHQAAEILRAPDRRVAGIHKVVTVNQVAETMAEWVLRTTTYVPQ